MKIISFLLLFSTNLFAVCEFNAKVSKIYSLSGPVTVALKELNLLKNPKLKALSIFHPVSKNEFAGEFIPGGIFVSREKMTEFNNSVVFYDESREMEKILKSMPAVQAVQVKTRGLIPHEVTKLVITNLRRYLAGCDEGLKAFEKKSKKAEEELLLKIKPVSVIFFIGQFINGKLPELMMVYDGVVKWLIMQNKIKTYPTKLAYVNWSAKILNEMPKGTLLVAMKDSGPSLQKEIKKHSGNKITVIYPGSLVPGISQLEAWIFWASSLGN